MMGLDEGVVVAGFMEDGLAAVAAVEHVIPHAAKRGSGSSCHATTVKYHPRTLNITYVPFCASCTLRELVAVFGIGHADSVRNLTPRVDRALQDSSKLRQDIARIRQELLKTDQI
jgi:hypothetical protein